MKKENINEKWSKPLAKILKNEIKKRKIADFDNFKQEDFAEELGISPATLTQLINENRNPRLDSIFNISEKLGCSIDYLVGLTDIKSREWDDLDKSAQVIANKTGLSYAALDHLINYFHKDEIDSLNELLTSVFSGSFLNRLSQYLNNVEQGDMIVFDFNRIPYEDLYISILSSDLKMIKKYSDNSINFYKSEIKRLQEENMNLDKHSDEDAEIYKINERQIEEYFNILDKKEYALVTEKALGRVMYDVELAAGGLKDGKK